MAKVVIGIASEYWKDKGRAKVYFLKEVDSAMKAGKPIALTSDDECNFELEINKEVANDTDKHKHSG